MTYTKKDLNVKAMFKFSEAKNADEYSFGGEDGLDETLSFLKTKDYLFRYSKWSDLSIYALKIFHLILF